MKVILKENIDNLGSTGDIVRVSEGYARNFLLPRDMVYVADENNVRSIEHHKRALSRKAEREKKAATDVAKKVEQFSVTIARKVGEHEKLFGSVTTKDIAEALNAGGFEIAKTQIHLPEPIKQLGVTTVEIKLGKDVSANVKVWVVQAKE